MKRLIIATIATTFALAAPAMAGKCTDEIKALEGKATSSDAAAKPGNQSETTSPGTSPKQGGGERSASAKLLEAQAHDQRGDEAECMKAIDEAKKEAM